MLEQLGWQGHFPWSWAGQESTPRSMPGGWIFVTTHWSDVLGAREVPLFQLTS